jgi:hypothetical protein|tara:strand:- start:452 stop:595 length:144 start_codon:yes stop_codon:yes gene_type:complete
MPDFSPLPITGTTLGFRAVVSLFDTRVPTGLTFLAYLTTGNRSLFLI